VTPRDKILLRMTVATLSGLSSAGYIFLVVANWSTARAFEVVMSVAAAAICGVYSAYMFRHVPKS
jgi:hypothetical protein